MIERTVLHTFRAVNPPWTLTFNVDGHYLVTANGSSELEVFDIWKLELFKIVKVHKTRAPNACISKDGKFILTISRSESIIWDAMTLEMIVVIDEVFQQVLIGHKLIVAIIHDSLYKKFNAKVLGEFSDDIKEDEETTYDD